MKKVLRVGVFGFYSYQNLGDNLMAYLFSRHIEEAGHEPIIFSKSRNSAMNWGFRTCADLKEFTESVDVIIFGGGGLLIPRPNPSGHGRDFNEDLRFVLDYSLENKTPLFGFSLGGAGKHLGEIVPVERQRLIKQLNYVALRNREDVHLIAEANTTGEFLDDVVWTTANKIPVDEQRQDRSRPRVGLNLYIGGSRPKLAKILLSVVVKLRRDIDFVFYDICPEDGDRFSAFCVHPDQENCSRKILVDLDEACREAQSLDLLITTRLHFGVMAMSYGVPSIAFAGAKKTEILYNRINRSAFFWGRWDAYRFLRLFTVPGALRKLIRDGRKPVDRDIIANAMKHYDRLATALDSVE